MKTYKVSVTVSTPVDTKNFAMLLIADDPWDARRTAEREFPKWEPQMTPANECNFYVGDVEEQAPVGTVLSCQKA